MPITVKLSVDSISARERNGGTRVVLVLDYDGTDIDFEDQIQEGEDLSIELPSTSPPA